MSSTEGQKLVIVLGGGVIGLTTAQFLLKVGYKVKLYARDLPGDSSINYTSPWAGAIWVPSPRDSPELKDWYIQSYVYFRDMVKKRPEEAKQVGVYFREAVIQLAVMPEEYIQKGVDAYWFSEVADNFKILPKSSLEPGMTFGQSFTTFCINSPVYLSYLQDNILDLGGNIIRYTVDLTSGENFLAALKSLAGDSAVWAYVNATGLGSKDLANDDTMFPVRGQTIYVKGEAEKVVLALKEPMAYVIPRVGSGYSLLGGTMDAGNWKEEPDEVVAENILTGCKVLAPELLNDRGEFEILSHNVGRRPSRKNGARIEVVESERGLRIVHCYGHGSGGFEMSIGSSNKVLQLVNALSAK